MQPAVVDLSISIPLDTLLTLGFYFMAALYVIFSAIMYYHWKEYSINEVITKTTFVIYTISTVPLILILAIITYFV